MWKNTLGCSVQSYIIIKEKEKNIVFFCVCIFLPKENSGNYRRCIERREWQSLPIFSARLCSCLLFCSLPCTFSIFLPDNRCIHCGAESKGSVGCVMAECVCCARAVLASCVSGWITSLLRLARTHECQTVVSLLVMNPCRRINSSKSFQTGRH